ncbi:hypothetical protein [Nocardiopsis sp. L17-MgMaSL7]|uniref:hypothetical protein n=1 Tax=Nocardiopsis sp. L17-MgMaSL7 TaxID=1938893 RepID=UPI000D7116B4|nr:hypothetical protein [Nocardiopsis sp. L17-MgMaSL7]PWV44612.1 hypothetical protein BDW27_12371 [Nocardiopsis sp. L17-MgMaSL7]
MADQRASSGWEGLPSPDSPGWEGWCVHWLAAHSPTALVQQVTATGASPRSHGRALWQYLADRREVLEQHLAQERMDGVTDRALEVREADRFQELDEIRDVIRVLETIGPYLPER